MRIRHWLIAAMRQALGARRGLGRRGPALRELSFLLRNHLGLPLAYQSPPPGLPRPSGSGSNLLLQPLPLLPILTFKPLTTPNPPVDFPAPVPLCCCPSAQPHSSRPSVSAPSSPEPSLIAPAPPCSCGSGISPSTLSTCVCLVWSYLPTCLISPSGSWLLKGVCTFYLCTPHWAQCAPQSPQQCL